MFTKRAKQEDVNLSSLDKELQLVISDKSPNFDLAMKLVASGADPNLKNMEGETLLHLLVHLKIRGTLLCPQHTRGNYLEKLAKEFRADVDVQNADGLSPLDIVINQPYKIDYNLAIFFVELGAYQRENKKGMYLIELLEREEKLGNNVTGFIIKILEQGSALIASDLPGFLVPNLHREISPGC
ncbi:MAG: hypothetical protein A3F13_06780 [Gammaproteobacteria bacterium RIFCSPHIGHO2_12_FULL_40_19]|nr:MAG: hypothetical protein A3F13_06780 [Gammaproteobacteria bacterium RIFCSPHIGHO2_12_FULL_40_19]